MNNKKNSLSHSESALYYKNLKRKLEIKDRILGNELEEEELAPLLERMDDFCDGVSESLKKINQKWKDDIFQ